MDKTLETATSLATKLFTGMESLVVKHGQDAIDLGLATVRVTGIASLFEGLVALIIGVAFLVAFRWCLKYWDRKYSDYEPMQYFGGLGAFIGMVTSACIALSIFFNVWNYVAIIKPEIWLAKKTIDKVWDLNKK